MSFSNTSETSVLAAIYNATPWANYLDNAVTAPQTFISTGLHTADPGETGTMLTSEATYTGYARQNVPRSSAGWTVSNGVVNPVANVDYPIATAGSEVANFFSTGKTGGGAAAIILSGSVSPTVNITPGVTPRLTTASSIALD